MSRAATAVIDLSALRHNLNKARQADPAARQFAVIKANAYGHGAVPVARALAQADGFAVASIGEALELRNASIAQPILLLEGVCSAQELALARRHELQLVVHHGSQVEMLESAADSLPAAEVSGDAIKLWLKVDTGMHRLGFALQEVASVWQRLRDCRLVHEEICLMTHLASADDFQDITTQKQLAQFALLLPEAGLPRSIANSAGILGWPDSHADIDRPGIMLYGVSPLLGENGAARGLRPVMTLQSRLIAVNRFRQGDTIGYGGSWTCPEDMPVGVAAIGYGDGYPRHAPSGTPLLLNGQRVPLVGRVSMDMICVDLRSQPEAAVGDPVVLWGQGLPAEEIAEHAGTIAYELFCNVSMRVEREYVGA